MLKIYLARFSHETGYQEDTIVNSGYSYDKYVSHFITASSKDAVKSAILKLYPHARKITVKLLGPV